MQSYRLQLRFVIRFLRGLLINHDTPPKLPASGRFQFAPDSVGPCVPAFNAPAHLAYQLNRPFLFQSPKHPKQTDRLVYSS